MNFDRMTVLRKHDSETLHLEGSYGRAALHESTAMSFMEKPVAEGYALLYRRQDHALPYLRLAFVTTSLPARVLKTIDLGEQDEEMQLDGRRLMLMKRKQGAGPNLWALDFESPLEATKCNESIKRAKEHPPGSNNSGPNAAWNGEAASSGLPGPPPPVLTPGSFGHKPPQAPQGPPPAVATPGSQLATGLPSGLPPPPAVATPGSRPAPTVPKADVSVPPPVATPGSRRPVPPVVRTAGDVPPPVPTPGSAASASNAAGAFPTTPRSGSLVGATGGPAGPAPAAPTPGSSGGIWNRRPSQQPQPPQQQQQPPQQQQQQQAKANASPALKQSVDMIQALAVSPPTYGPQGWRAGPDLNELRLAVIKVAMADTTSVATLEAMLDAFRSM